MDEKLRQIVEKVLTASGIEVTEEAVEGIYIFSMGIKHGEFERIMEIAQFFFDSQEEFESFVHAADAGIVVDGGLVILGSPDKNNN